MTTMQKIDTCFLPGAYGNTLLQMAVQPEICVNPGGDKTEFDVRPVIEGQPKTIKPPRAS